MKNRIVLLEAHVFVRHAVASLLERQGELEVVAEAGMLHELLECETEFQLLVTGLSLPGSGGIAAIAAARRRWPQRRILVRTRYVDPLRAAEALAAGADGYVVKSDDEETILEAVRAVLAGERFVSPQLDRDALAKLLQEPRGHKSAGGPLALLSSREREVFDLLVRGHSSRQTAHLLLIGQRTVETHRAHIYAKLDVHSAAALVRFGVRSGLIGDDIGPDPGRPSASDLDEPHSRKPLLRAAGAGSA